MTPEERARKVVPEYDICYCHAIHDPPCRYCRAVTEIRSAEEAARAEERERVYRWCQDRYGDLNYRGEDSYTSARASARYLLTFMYDADSWEEVAAIRGGGVMVTREAIEMVSHSVDY